MLARGTSVSCTSQWRSVCACCCCLPFSILKLRLPHALTDCRDLIRRMLEADPAVRASLDEVLAHRWMNPIPGPRSLVGAYEAAKTTYAALRWAEAVDHDGFFRTPDDGWRNKHLGNILELFAQLCEAPDIRRPDQTWPSVVPRLRSCAWLHWTRLFGALKGRPSDQA